MRKDFWRKEKKKFADKNSHRIFAARFKKAVVLQETWLEIEE
jgi:hypothetical protein